MMTTPERFEDRLLHELRQVVADRPAPVAAAHTRSNRTRLAFGGVGVAAATAVFAVIATTGDVTPSAYAVQPHASGAVTVSIHSLSDASGLQRALRAAGVPAVVDYSTGVKVACATAVLGADGKPAMPTTVTGSVGVTTSVDPGVASATLPPEAGSLPRDAPSTVEVGANGATFTIDPSTIKPGEKVYVTTVDGAVSTIGMAVATTEPAPVCPPAP